MKVNDIVIMNDDYSVEMKVLEIETDCVKVEFLNQKDLGNTMWFFDYELKVVENEKSNR